MPVDRGRHVQDWELLSPLEFEQLTYDLLHAMGFKNVDWRKGTSMDVSPADSGRDIEADLFRKDPDGGEHIEHWFVEAKHRKGSVPPSELESSLSWASTEQADVLLIATSGYVSNRAKDNLKKRVADKRDRFRIRYWERVDLERLLSDFPDLVDRHFSRGSVALMQGAGSGKGSFDPLAIIRPTPEGKMLREIDRLRRDVDQALRH